MDSPKKFKTAVLGGTFDHFHKGHKRLIEHGLSVSKRLVIGVTSDEFVKKIKNQKSKIKNPTQNLKVFEDFWIRKSSVGEFLEARGRRRYQIIKIDDVFGTTLDRNFPAEAIIISKETLEGAKIINIARKEKNLPPLKIIIQDLVLAKDGKPVSSFRIRKGEIDREGKLLVKPQWYKTTPSTELTRSDLVITDEIRRELKKPLGKLSRKINRKSLENLKNVIIAVGDETSRVLNHLSIPIDISVVDFKIAREKRFNSIQELGFLGNEKVIKVKNPAGSISRELFEAIINIFKNNLKGRKIILIDGEDDLSVLPMVLASPLGSRIFYGQPAEGVVEVEVSEKNKTKIHKIVARFTTRGY